MKKPPEWWWWSSDQGRPCIYCDRTEQARIALILLNGPQVAGPVHLATTVTMPPTTTVQGVPVCATHRDYFLQVLAARAIPATEAASA
jgi:hypothetical protein